MGVCLQKVILKVMTRPCSNGPVPHGVLDTLSCPPFSHQEAQSLEVTPGPVLFDYGQSLVLTGPYIPSGPSRKGGHLFLNPKQINPSIKVDPCMVCGLLDLSLVSWCGSLHRSGYLGGLKRGP